MIVTVPIPGVEKVEPLIARTAELLEEKLQDPGVEVVGAATVTPVKPYVVSFSSDPENAGLPFATVTESANAPAKVDEEMVKLVGPAVPSIKARFANVITPLTAVAVFPLVQLAHDGTAAVATVVLSLVTGFPALSITW